MPPRVPRFRNRPQAFLGLRPVDRRKSERALADPNVVPQQVLAADEVPSPLAPLVGVVVEDRLMDPPPRALDLALAVHLADGVRIIDEIDHVRANIEDGHAHAAKAGFERRTKRFSSAIAPPYLDIVNEKLDERVEIARVDSESISRRQLAYLLVCNEFLYSVQILRLPRMMRRVVVGA